MSRIVHVLLTMVLVYISAFAAVPQQISYQGRLTQNGVGVPDSTYQLTFSVYSSSSGGTPLWTSGSQLVAVKGGLFSYNLGTSTPLPPSLFSSDTLRWLGIKVGLGAELTPRTKLVSTAFAYKAQVADTATYALSAPSAPNGWTDTGTKVLLTTLGDTLGIGITNPSAKVHVEAASTEAKLGGTEGVYGKHFASFNYGNLGSATSGALGIGAGTFTGMRGVTQSGRGVWGTATMAAGYGVWGEHQSNGYYGYLGGDTSGVFGYGVTGVKGTTQGGEGVYGSASMLTGFGVWGANTAAGTGGYLGGQDVGVYGSATAPKRAGHFQGNVYISNGLGLGVTNPSRKIYVLENVNGTSLPLKLDNPDYHYGSITGILFSLGGSGGGVIDTIRGKGALAYELTDTWNRGKFHFLQNRLAQFGTPSLADAVVTITNNGDVGIGTTAPVTALEIRDTSAAITVSTLSSIGSIRFKRDTTSRWSLGWDDVNNYFSVYEFGASAGHRLVVRETSGNLGVGLTDPVRKLQVRDSLGSLALPLKIENHNANLNSSVGIQFSAGGSGPDRGKGALVYQATDTWNRGKFHILQDAGVDTTNPTVADAVVTVANNGNVGIGDTNPQAKLVVNGDLVVNGAFRGNNGTSGGAPFPRPAFNSGWLEMPPGSEAIFPHNLGGNPENYFVVLDCNCPGDCTWGIHQVWVGGEYLWSDYDNHNHQMGAEWLKLTSQSVTVRRGSEDLYCPQVRVRIWVAE